MILHQIHSICTKWNSIFDNIAFSRPDINNLSCVWGQDNFLRCQQTSHYDRGTAVHFECGIKYQNAGLKQFWAYNYLSLFLPKYLGSLHFLESTIVNSLYVILGLYLIRGRRIDGEDLHYSPFTIWISGWASKLMYIFDVNNFSSYLLSK